MEKLTWTESGLELLANVQRDMIRWEGMEYDVSTRCSKPNCAFCNYVAPIDEPEHVVVMQSSINSESISRKDNYTPSEIAIIKGHINYSLKELMKLLPGRPYHGISTKRSQIRQRLIKFPYISTIN